MWVAIVMGFECLLKTKKKNTLNWTVMMAKRMSMMDEHDETNEEKEERVEFILLQKSF